MTWNDFNTASDQHDLIHAGTLAKVRMTIRPGGYDDPSQGWTGGYATHSRNGEAVFLDCEFVILEGPFVRRKVWNNIGLYSPNGPAWGDMGRSFIRGILHSARGINPKDNSPTAQAARRISSIAELDGLVFIAKISVTKDSNGNDRNEIKEAIPPTHKDYAALMGAAPMMHQATTLSQPAYPPAQGYAPPPAAAPTANPTRPAWAQ